jgi:integrase
MCRSVLSGMCGHAARHDALAHNPVKALGKLSGKPRKAPRSLDVPQLRQLRAALTYDDQAVARDLPDFVAFMMATGLRIGEASAITWDAIDLYKGTADVSANIVRVKAKGLIRKTTKTATSQRMLLLPSWCVAMLRDRYAQRFDNGAVFAAPLGGWRDPSNTQADLRQAFANAGFGWVTSHVFRKSVATVMDKAGRSNRDAADQLGHASPSMTADVYMGRKVLITGAADALEPVGQ